jgi:hypothetical protein
VEESSTGLFVHELIGHEVALWDRHHLYITCTAQGQPSLALKGRTQQGLSRVWDRTFNTRNPCSLSPTFSAGFSLSARQRNERCVRDNQEKGRVVCDFVIPSPRLRLLKSAAAAAAVGC